MEKHVFKISTNICTPEMVDLVLVHIWVDRGVSVEDISEQLGFFCR